jgi:hypothetical protein
LVGFGVGFLFLTGCAPDRTTADKKLAKACQAAVVALLSDDVDIEIQSTDFKNTMANDGYPLRLVVLNTYLSTDGGGYQDKSYQCAFSEDTGMFKMGYSVKVEYIDFDGEIYGKQDGLIQGDFQENEKITEAVDKVFFATP